MFAVASQAYVGDAQASRPPLAQGRTAKEARNERAKTKNPDPISQLETRKSPKSEAHFRPGIYHAMKGLSPIRIVKDPPPRRKEPREHWRGPIARKAHGALSANRKNSPGRRGDQNSTLRNATEAARERKKVAPRPTSPWRRSPSDCQPVAPLIPSLAWKAAGRMSYLYLLMADPLNIPPLPIESADSYCDRRPSPRDS